MLPRILCSYVLMHLYVESWEGCLGGHSQFMCYSEQLLLLCRDDMPSSLVSLHQMFRPICLACIVRV